MSLRCSDVVTVCHPAIRHRNQRVAPTDSAECRTLVRRGPATHTPTRWASTMAVGCRPQCLHRLACQYQRTRGVAVRLQGVALSSHRGTRPEASRHRALTVVDLFAGAGGLSE